MKYPPLFNQQTGENTMDTFTVTEGEWKNEKVHIFKDLNSFRAEFKDCTRWGDTWRDAVFNVLSNFDLQHLITKYSKPLNTKK